MFTYFHEYLVLYQLMLRCWDTCFLIHVTGVVFPTYMDRGRPHAYPPGIVPTHPLIILGFVARGSI